MLCLKCFSTLIYEHTWRRLFNIHRVILSNQLNNKQYQHSIWRRIANIMHPYCYQQCKPNLHDKRVRSISKLELKIFSINKYKWVLNSKFFVYFNEQFHFSWQLRYTFISFTSIEAENRILAWQLLHLHIKQIRFHSKNSK